MITTTTQTVNSPETLALARKHRLLVPCVNHFYSNPPLFVSGKGQILIDASGREYLDMFSGVSVNHLGHAHPAVVEAVQDQIATLAHMTTIYLTDPMLDLAERLIAITPPHLEKVFFCASGSEANEAACFMAQQATGCPGIVSLNLGLHGLTKLTMSLTGLPMWKTDQSPVPDVHHAPAPHCYRCTLGHKPEACAMACSGALDALLAEHEGTISAVIMEPVMGNGGIVVPPKSYMKAIRDISRRHGCLLIIDEVQTGFGRTGRMFGFEHFDIDPDIITVAKALGGGLPAAAAIATETVAQTFTRPRASSFGGNLVAMRAGCAVIDTIIEENLTDRAADLGQFFLDQLRDLQNRHPRIGDVRGLGLMLGAELIHPDGSPDAVSTDQVLESMLRMGILVGKAGRDRNVLVFEPPLIISQQDILRTVACLDKALQECEQHETH